MSEDSVATLVKIPARQLLFQRIRLGLIIASDTTTHTSGYIRRVTLEDIVLRGQLDYNNGTRIPRCGIYIKCAQDVTLKNVKISQFQKGAIVLDDSFDNYFNDVEIKWSGYGDSPAAYAYALQLAGAIDNSNNNRFTNLHMEFCPLEILFEHNARQNFFVNFKLEHGGETYQNASGLSPIYFKGGIENQFTNGQIVQGNSPKTYRIKSDSNPDAYLTTYNIRQQNTFSNVLFFANSLSKARWYTGYNTVFRDATVQRANGASGGYAFDLVSRNSVSGGSISVADNGSNFFRITGDNNVLDKVTLVTFGEGAAAGTTGITLSSGATRNDLDWVVTGPISSEFTAGAAFGTAGTLGNNIVRCDRDATASTSGGGQKNVLHRTYLKLTDSSAATYTGFLNGYTGQRLTIVATTANVTLQHGTTASAIAMKSGANKTLATNETITFQNIDGVWREVYARSKTPVEVTGGLLFSYFCTAGRD